MITWMAMVSTRDRPREGAQGAQITYRGDPEKGYRGGPGPAWVRVQRPEEGHRANRVSYIYIAADSAADVT